MPVLCRSFQLTRSRGAWRGNADYLHRRRHFNSHAHVERDCYQQPSERLGLYFNSHAHVERDLYDSVQPYAEYNFNSHAHVERDLSADTATQAASHFNSHAHVERDGTAFTPVMAGAISTHTLTWSVTQKTVPTGAKLIFQLTRSRGAWPTTAAERSK